MITQFLIKIYRFIQGIVNNILNNIAKKIFVANCKVGANFACSTSAKCINDNITKNNIIIGDNCELNCTIISGKNAKIQIGNNTTVRNYSKIFSMCSIEIGDNVIISNNVTISDNNNHPVDPQKRIEMSKSGFYSNLWHLCRNQLKYFVRSICVLL